MHTLGFDPFCISQPIQLCTINEADVKVEHDIKICYARLSLNKSKFFINSEHVVKQMRKSFIAKHKLYVGIFPNQGINVIHMKYKNMPKIAPCLKNTEAVSSPQAQVLD